MRASTRKPGFVGDGGNAEFDGFGVGEFAGFGGEREGVACADFRVPVCEGG